MSGTTTTVPLRYLPHSNRSHRYIDVASRPTPKIGMLWIARDRLSVAYRDVNGTTFPVAQPESAKLPWLIAEQGRGHRIGTRRPKVNEAQVFMIKGYREKIEAEIAKICEDILEVLDKHLITSAASGESKVLYHKMMGDYHHDLADATGDCIRRCRHGVAPDAPNPPRDQRAGEWQRGWNLCSSLTAGCARRSLRARCERLAATENPRGHLLDSDEEDTLERIKQYLTWHFVQATTTEQTAELGEA
ncbi:hypothetical protein B0H14DRAFT_2615121 [Mycena olivaceomarginata]|nr:hypothetical protein B0H14DRAFT_2615121 [Mycena olivaceomarginata]